MKFHDELNPKIWDAHQEKHIDRKTNYYLKREVKNKLDEIAKAFIEYLDIPEDAIEDIRLVGSSANYNYTDFSDIDVHVIVDYDKVHEDCPLVTGYLWALKTLFNDEHDITIYGIPVELYAEDSKLPGISNGVYSLLENKWLSIPEKVEVTVDDSAVARKSEEFEELIDKADTSEKASELLLKIYKMRKAGLQENGEYSTENLAFKNLRNKGLIDKLWDLKKQGIDKELSLNEELNNKIYYHGSNQKFDTFDKSKIKENKLGLMFNFTDDYSIAYQYGDNIIKAHLDLKNPLTDEDFKHILTYEEDCLLCDTMGFPKISKERFEQEQSRYKETLGSLFDLMKMKPKFIEFLKKLGYDGIAIQEDHHFGVFEPEQIHIIQDSYNKNSQNEKLEKAEIQYGYSTIDTIISFDPSNYELQGLLNKHKALRILVAQEPGSGKLQLICMPATSGDHGLLATWLMEQGYKIFRNSFYHIVNSEKGPFLTLDSFYKNSEDLKYELLDELNSIYDNQELINKMLDEYDMLKELLPSIVNTEAMDYAIGEFL